MAKKKRVEGAGCRKIEEYIAGPVQNSYDRAMYVLRSCTSLHFPARLS